MTKGSSWIIVGLVLLGAMFVGARMLFPNSAASTTQKGDDKPSESPPMVVSWGFFDVDQGMTMLYPRQSGNVTYVHAESARAKDGEVVKVKAGDLLLQIDDVMVKLKIEEAKADVKASEQQLAEAKKLPEMYKLQAEQQEAAVKSADLERERFKADIDAKLTGLDKESAQARKYRELAKFGEEELVQKKKAEEKKLAQIKLQDADLKIKQAEADLQAKQARVKQAEEAIKYCQITAPSEGYVLRVHARKGETLGSSPRQAAVEFLPDAPIIVRAEVLQEWGRYVKPGKDVTIEDDTYNGPKWTGVVKKVSDWYLPTRSPVIEPFRFNDVRTLEAIIEVTGGDSPKRIGQRVRAKIKIS